MRRRGFSFGNVSGSTGIAIGVGLLIVVAIVIFMIPKSTPTPVHTQAPVVNEGVKKLPTKEAVKNAPVVNEDVKKPSYQAPAPQPMSSPAPQPSSNSAPTYQAPAPSPSNPTPAPLSTPVSSTTWIAIGAGSHQLWASPTLTNNNDYWTLLPNGNDMNYYNVVQLPDKSFLAMRGNGSGRVFSSNYITSPWTDMTTTNTLWMQQVLPLKDGTFACLEYGSDYIWTSNSTTFSTNKNDWKKLGPNPVDNTYNWITQLNNGTFAAVTTGYNNGGKNDKIVIGRTLNELLLVNANTSLLSSESGQDLINVKQVIQLSDGSFAAVEYYSDSIWVSPVLTGIKSMWNPVDSGSPNLWRIINITQ